MLAAKDKRELRQIAHHLPVVVTIGDKGLTDGVAAETERALVDHEVIKVRIAGERDERKAMGDALAETVGADVVTRIGRIVVLFRENPEADPLLSNRARYRTSG